MKHTKTFIAVVTALGLGVATSASLYAHGGGFGHGPMGQGDASMGHTQMGAGMMGGGAHGMGSDEMMSGGGHGPISSVDAQQRLETVKSELGITSEQESAWQKYSQAVTEAAEEHQEATEAHREGRMYMDAPGRQAQRTEMMEQRLASHQAVTEALQELYPTLSDEQKEKADRLLGHRRFGTR